LAVEELSSGVAGSIHQGDIKHPTIILEAVASYDRWIWHAFFGVAGSNNDINVLNQSPLFTNLVRGEAPIVNFTVNGHQYDKGYLSVFVLPASNGVCKITLSYSEMVKLKIRDKDLAWFGPLFER